MEIPELEALAGDIRAAAFDLEIDALEYWPHNRIAWAGTKIYPRTLATLAASLHDGLVTLGFEEDDRPYVPHVTLVRNAERAPEKIAWKPIIWSVREFVLVESVLVRGAARYEVIARWPLVV